MELIITLLVSWTAITWIGIKLMKSNRKRREDAHQYMYSLISRKHYAYLGQVIKRIKATINDEKPFDSPMSPELVERGRKTIVACRASQRYHRRMMNEAYLRALRAARG